MILAAMIASAVTVEGDTTCPTAAQVSVVLDPLLADTDADEPHRARLIERADGIEVELRNELGRSLAQRTFSRQTSCDEMASVIAVVIATWEASYTGDAPDVRVSALAPSVPLAVISPSSTTITLAAGAFAALDDSGWSGGATAAVAIGPRRSRWSTRIAAVIASRKRDALGTGEIAWAREALALGARYRVAESGPLTIALGGDLALGVLVASGEGFTVNRTAYSFDPGVTGGVTARIRLRSDLRGFVEGSETWWWRAGQLEVTGITDMPQLPAYELHVVSGLEWRPK